VTLQRAVSLQLTFERTDDTSASEHRLLAGVIYRFSPARSVARKRS
jgi:hypothetical protein